MRTTAAIEALPRLATLVGLVMGGPSILIALGVVAMYTVAWIVLAAGVAAGLAATSRPVGRAGATHGRFQASVRFNPMSHGEWWK